MQNQLLNNRKVTPDEVIQEFNREPDRHYKYKLAIVRFKEECCLRGLPLKGQKVTTNAVVHGLQSVSAILELARFKELCCLRGLALHGRQVTPDEVIQDYQAAGANLELARFKAECCLKGGLVNGQRILPDEVVKDFPDNPRGKLGLARFKADCCLNGLALNGQQVTADEVVKDFQAVGVFLELAHFKEQCCLRGVALNGREVTTDEVVQGFPNSPEGKLGIARFKEKCCLRGLVLNDRQVTPDEVDFPDTPEGLLGMARFRDQCWLKSLTLNGQLVTADEVAKGYQAAGATLELIRLKEQCCLLGQSLNGQPVTADEVVKDYQEARAALEMARFKQECCLKKRPLNGQQVTADEVVRDFPDSLDGRLGLAHFREKCCLKGLALNGQPVTPEAVVNGFPNSPEGRLGIVRFKAECCLRGLLLKGRRVTTDEVVKDFQAIRATLELVCFKEQCCLKGLALNGQQITPYTVVKGFQLVGATLQLAHFKAECCLRGLVVNDRQVTPAEVVKGFPESPEGKLGRAHFKAECCLKGRLLNGQQVTADEVVKDYQAARATLELGRFMEQCCLRNLRLNGQPVTPAEVVNAFPESPEGKLGIARFKEKCCLRGLLLNNQQVTPDAVIKDFPDSPEGKLGIACFKSQCCLMGLLLNDQQVTPQAVIKDYECGSWWLERAIFYAQLALNARELNGSLLDNQKVLEAFNKVPGDNSSRQVRYLIQRLKHPQQYHETNEARKILQTAWQILNNVSSKDDEQHRLQSLLQFMALYHELPIDRQRVSAGQVYRSLTLLRSSFQNSRLHFFFLSHCHITRQPVNGRYIHKGQVLECLQSFPAGTALRHALGFWFEQSICEANLMENILHNLKAVVPARWDSDGVYRYATSASQHSSAASAVAGSGALQPSSKQWLNVGEPGLPDIQLPRLHALKLKTFEIIAEVNRFYADPPILITGSYARFLQNRCSLFIDIDIQCTSDESARKFLEKLQVLNTDSDSVIPQSMVIWATPGCQATKQPKVYNVHLNYGDLGAKLMGLHISVDTGVADEKATQLAATGVERTFSDLSFAEQTRSLNDTLGFLVNYLDLLTVEFQKGAVFELPETLLFNNPKNPDERIYGLLTCALMSLSYAREFIARHSSGGKPDLPPDSPQEAYQRLHTLTATVQTQLNNHAYRDDFEQIVKDLLSTIQNESDDDIERKDLIKLVLAMFQPPGEVQ
ncbi:hypothetical protein [Endozoicomonas sp. GU-1]|uniref:hypothetical protein n=1 Tax=Endozoicomonas sp. GU-1 TaxID=3009078 RepID=UPI0022B3F3C6|nr:hypothetical protein [Endozoicomonas sp. GU-1]WBA82330.1 hypothetical protein O2T12_04015 [Endozoicomonas sp. GU-1]WBA85266.1 hypothetical protein O3276_18705 [Endozoicomonas sp. GU-1]